MARLARVVIPGVPHHVVQRGNRRQSVFFQDRDKAAYLKILREQAEEFKLSIWAYCLMDNHVHLIVVPPKKESLAEGIGETNRLYTRMINFRKGWRGYLWQGRFRSYSMEERHLFAAVRYVERNPVRAKIVNRAAAYPWSSARAHVNKLKDGILDKCYLEDEIDDWERYLGEWDGEEDISLIRQHTRTGRPAGDVNFIRTVEKITGRMLTKRKPGPKVKN